MPHLPALIHPSRTFSLNPKPSEYLEIFRNCWLLRASYDAEKDGPPYVPAEQGDEIAFFMPAIQMLGNDGKPRGCPVAVAKVTPAGPGSAARGIKIGVVPLFVVAKKDVIEASLAASTAHPIPVPIAKRPRVGFQEADAEMATASMSAADAKAVSAGYFAVS